MGAGVEEGTFLGTDFVEFSHPGDVFIVVKESILVQITSDEGFGGQGYPLGSVLRVVLHLVHLLEALSLLRFGCVGCPVLDSFSGDLSKEGILFGSNFGHFRLILLID